MTRGEFVAVVNDAPPGHSWVYHVGDLAYESEGAIAVRDLREAAWRCAKIGMVHLTQRRRPDIPFMGRGASYEYIATMSGNGGQNK